MDYWALGMSLILAGLVALPFVARRRSAVRGATGAPGLFFATSRHAFVSMLIATVNTVPFAPIWPGSSGGDGFVDNWLAVFLVVNLPVWLIVVTIWVACRNWPPLKRSCVSELPGLLQLALWSLFYIEFMLLLLVVRVVDGALLFVLAKMNERSADASEAIRS